MDKSASAVAARKMFRMGSLPYCGPEGTRARTIPARKRRARVDSSAATIAQVGQERGQQPDEWQVRANVEDELDAMLIGNGAEEGGADAAQPEREAEEEAGHRAHFAGNEFLRINQNGGEGRGENEADDR